MSKIMINTVEQFKRQYYETRLIPCLRVNDSIMNEIEKEVRTLVKNYKILEESIKKHHTDFTKPYGTVTQSCLYNTTGNILDFSTDYKMLKNGKFFFDPNFKNIHHIVKLFQNNLINFWLYGISKNSGSSPHKVISSNYGKKFRIRFHLPIITNSSAWVMLDWKKFWLKRGIIYFFNDGCIHTAGNDGDQTRYHLIWDCMLDDKLFDTVLNVNNNNSPDPKLISRIPKEDIKDLMYSEPCEETDYEIEKIGFRNRLVRMLKSKIPK